MRNVDIILIKKKIRIFPCLKHAYCKRCCLKLELKHMEECDATQPFKLKCLTCSNVKSEEKITASPFNVNSAVEAQEEENYLREEPINGK